MRWFYLFTAVVSATDSPTQDLEAQLTELEASVEQQASEDSSLLSILAEVPTARELVPKRGLSCRDKLFIATMIGTGVILTIPSRFLFRWIQANCDSGIDVSMWPELRP